MPHNEHVISVFVANPSDVDDEITILEEVINKLNLSLAREYQIRFELIHWLTHTRPGIGEDAQAVINAQIPDDYDIFLSLMWCRYGTPTGRADSGTVEEFERAKARYDADPESVSLMIYFKDAPIPPSQLDPNQLAKVNNFRESLSNEGVLYRSFNDENHFEELIRSHLIQQLLEWKKRLDVSTEASVQQADEIDQIRDRHEENNDDDLGFIDYLDVFEDRFHQLLESTENMTEATEDIGNKMSKRTNEMESLPTDSQGNVNRRKARRIISLTASDMNDYTVRMEAEIPIFSNSLTEGMEALISASSINMEFSSDSDSIAQAKESLDDIRMFRESLKVSEQSMKEFREIVFNLPRMTIELNRSKRGVISALDKLISEIGNGQSLLLDAEKIINDKIEV